MRFHAPEQKDRDYSRSLVVVGREVLSLYPFSERRPRHSGEDFDLVQIGQVCLNSEEGTGAAKEVCQHLAEAIASNRVSVFNYSGFLSILAQTHPVVFLDAFVGNKEIKDHQRRRMFADGFDNKCGNPLDQISENDIISWCNEDPGSRYLQLASAMETIVKAGEEGTLVWKSIVYSILERAQDLDKVLEYFAQSMVPMVWSGSLADILQHRLVLFEALYEHHNAEVRAWAKQQHSAFQEWIKKEREWEKGRSRELNESFE